MSKKLKKINKSSNLLLKKIHLAILFLFLATSCGGGGGGGGGSPATNSTNNNANNSETANNPAETPSDNWISEVSQSEIDEFVTDEYNNFYVQYRNIITGDTISFKNYNLENINAAKAYALLKKNDKNYSGKDVKIAIIDSGVKADHVDISSNFDSDNSYNQVDNNYIVDDEDGHGTHVASIAAGSKNNQFSHGVAYDADIMAIKAGNGSFAVQDIVSSIDYAVDHNAKVINLSLGAENFSNEDIRQSLINAKNNDILSAIATGNDGNSQPSFPANLASDAELLGSIISVGAVDEQNNIADFSNYCGSTKDFCLVAPGVNIVGAYIDDTVEVMSGTSMAAPHVTGAAAIIRGAWPHLTAQQTAEIILTTATDLGDQGVDEIYGHGLLNLGEAVQAQGQNLIASGSKIEQGGYDLRDTEILSNSIFGDAFTVNIAPKLQQAVFYDKYGRDYKANLGSKIINNEPNIIKIADISFNNVKKNIAPINLQKFGYNSQITLSFDSFVDKSINNELGLKFATLDRSIDQSLDQDNGFAFQQNLKDFNKNIDLDLGFAFNIDQTNNLSSHNNTQLGLVGNMVNSNAFQSFLTTANDQNSSGRKFNQIFARKKLFNDKLDVITSLQNSYDSKNIKINDNKENQIIDLSLSYQINPQDNISLSFGELNESKNNILNSRAKGAFASNSDNKTSYAKISFKKNIFNDVDLYLTHTQGKSDLKGNSQGIFRKFDDVKLQSSSATIVHNNFFDGKIGLTYLEPLRVYSGRVDFDISVARDINGNLQRYQDSASLKPNGKERNIELFFDKNLSQNNSIQFNFLVQKEPGNNKNAKDQYMGLMRYNSKF